MKKTIPTKVAFGLFRQQPLTNGHFRVYSEMIRDNDMVIIGLGSVQISGTRDNPFTEKQRTDFIRKVFGEGSKDKVKIVPINDIGAVERDEWVAHCIKRISDKNLPTPTRYYAGSETDLDWFQGALNNKGNEIEMINMDRDSSQLLSGTRVRQSISTGSQEWKSFVPECLIETIENSYPKDLLLSYHRDTRRSYLDNHD